VARNWPALIPDAQRLLGAFEYVQIDDEAAAAALGKLSSAPASPEPGLTTGEWLWRWLESRVSLREAARRSYTAHVRGYLVPARLAGVIGRNETIQEHYLMLYLQY
jgi:hypothetical protein